MISNYVVKVIVKDHDTGVEEISKELSHTSLSYSIDEVDGETIYIIIVFENDDMDAGTEYVQSELSRTKLNWNLEDVFDGIDDDFFGPVTPFTNEDGGL